MFPLMPDDWAIRAAIASFAVLLLWAALVVLALEVLGRALDRCRARRAARARPAPSP